MRKDLLIKAAELLEADAANKSGVRFNLATWGHRSGNDPDKTRSPWQMSCGTQACAMGLFAISGIFYSEGLELPHPDDWNFTPQLVGKTLFPVKGFLAAQRLFDIDRRTAYLLFDPAYYGDNTKGVEAELEVARRIRELVETGGLSIDPQ